MQSSRAPLCVFFAAFITFAIAFSSLLALLKPRLEQRHRDEQAKHAEPPHPKDAAVSASLGAMAHGGRPPGTARPTSLRAIGRVVDARGAPIAGATVVFTDPSTNVVATCSSDESGQFDASFAATPDLNASASAAGYQSSTPSPLPGDSALQQIGDLVLRDGGAVRLRISGDAAGAIQNATVTLLPMGEGDAAALAQAHSSADGSAILRGIDCGSYRLRIEAEGHARAERNWRFDGIGRAGTDELAFVLLPLTSYVSGTANDSTAEAIDRGEVVARLVRPDPPSSQTWRSELAGDGAFRIGPLPRGTYEVHLQVDGMVQQGHLYAEADGEPIEIVAGHGGSLHGRFDDDFPLSQAPTLSLWKLDRAGQAQPLELEKPAVVDLATREFRLDGVAPGRYVLRGVADGYAPTRTDPFELAIASAPDAVLLRFGGGGAVTGTLVDHRGAPLRGARVTLFEGMAPPPAAWASTFPHDAHSEVATDGDGRFSLSMLAPGSQVAVFEAAGQPPRSFGPLWVAEGVTTALPELSIAGGTVLSITLHDGAGTVAASGRVRVSSTELGVDVTTIADEQGNVCLRGMPAGKYWLTPCDGSEPREVTLTTGETLRCELLHSSR